VPPPWSPRASLVADARVFIGFINRPRGRRSSVKLLHVSEHITVTTSPSPR
jgi:hypothetical protein